MSSLELYGTATCPYTSEMREWLEWSGKDFQEFDVESDQRALARMRAIIPAPYTVPILVEDGKVVRVGWQGRGCIVAAK
jgi:glutaredoxin